jgi:hypothetical protein
MRDGREGLIPGETGRAVKLVTVFNLLRAAICGVFNKILYFSLYNVQFWISAVLTLTALTWCCTYLTLDLHQTGGTCRVPVDRCGEYRSG